MILWATDSTAFQHNHVVCTNAYFFGWWDWFGDKSKHLQEGGSSWVCYGWAWGLGAPLGDDIRVDLWAWGLQGHTALPLSPASCPWCSESGDCDPSNVTEGTRAAACFPAILQSHCTCSEQWIIFDSFEITLQPRKCKKTECCKKSRLSGPLIGKQLHKQGVVCSLDASSAREEPGSLRTFS